MGLNNPSACEKLTRRGPLLACVTAVITLVTCLVVTKALGHETGGLFWPFLSDAGREAPEYYVFAIGLTVAALGFACTSVHLFRLTSNVTHLRGSARGHMARSRVVSLLAGFLGSVALAVLAVCSDSRYPTPHFVGAVTFFSMGMTYTTTVTILFHVLYRSRQGDKAAPLLDKLRTSVRNKIMLLVLSWVTFLIYLPIGYPIVARCITYDKAKNDWDYSCDLPVNNVRAISQFLCVVSMLAFFGTISTDFSYQRAFFGQCGETQRLRVKNPDAATSV